MLADKGAVVVDGEEQDPVGDYVCNYLVSRTNETPHYDFKWTLDITRQSQDVAKIMKDVCAFSNYGGGWLILGIKQNDHADKNIRGKFVKVGLPNSFELEDAALQEKINSNLTEPISIRYKEFYHTVRKENRRFALIYLPPSSTIVVSKKDIKYRVGNKDKVAVHKDAVYTRRGTQSIEAWDVEQVAIERRLERENYRCSILSGEPDQVREEIYSNLFEVKSVPKKVYVGAARCKPGEMIKFLQQAHPEQPYFPLKCRPYNGKIVTFADLDDPADIHSEIVLPGTKSQESVSDWLEDPDKEDIVVSLLNMEVVGKADERGMRYDRRAKRLYYVISQTNEERKEKWPTRHKGVQEKQVAKRLDPDHFLHSAVRTAIMRINGRFYLRLNTTMLITGDGRTPMTGMKEGAIITSQTYRTYNKQQLNNILFWINKLGNGGDVVVSKDFVISNKPVRTGISVGISWDIPTSNIKQVIEESNKEAEQMEIEYAEDENYEF